LAHGALLEQAKEAVPSPIVTLWDRQKLQGGDFWREKKSSREFGNIMELENIGESCYHEGIGSIPEE
jgi:hypothetical protein